MNEAASRFPIGVRAARTKRRWPFVLALVLVTNVVACSSWQRTPSEGAGGSGGAEGANTDKPVIVVPGPGGAVIVPGPTIIDPPNDAGPGQDAPTSDPDPVNTVTI
jgi:hypothetical protein